MHMSIHMSIHMPMHMSLYHVVQVHALSVHMPLHMSIRMSIPIPITLEEDLRRTEGQSGI